MGCWGGFSVALFWLLRGFGCFGLLVVVMLIVLICYAIVFMIGLRVVLCLVVS